MLRRPLTRVEVKLSDLGEFEDVERARREEKGRNPERAAETDAEAQRKLRALIRNERIGYQPEPAHPRPEQGAQQRIVQ